MRHAENRAPCTFLAVSSSFFQLTSFPPNEDLSRFSSLAASKVKRSRIKWSPRYSSNSPTAQLRIRLHGSAVLASLGKYFPDSFRVVGKYEALSQKFHEGIVETTKRQLQFLADKRKVRVARAASHAGDFDRDEMALVEEIEDSALEDMAKMLATFDPNRLQLFALYHWVN